MFYGTILNSYGIIIEISSRSIFDARQGIYHIIVAAI